MKLLSAERVKNENKTFLILEVEFENIGNKKEYIRLKDFTLTDSNNYKYDPVLSGNRENYLDIIENLLPKQKIKRVVIFEILDELTDLKINYNFGGYSEVDITTWKIKE